jgi:hypothetical protein
MGTGYSCDCLPGGVDPGRFNPFRPEPAPKRRRKPATDQPRASGQQPEDAAPAGEGDDASA